MSVLGELLELLKTSEVIFEYRTANGRLKRVSGTLNLSRISPMDMPKSKRAGLPAPKTDENSVRARMYQPYYDLDKGEWRRFKVLRLIRIVSSRLIQPKKPIKPIEF
jgi:hypothetical protein